MRDWNWVGSLSKVESAFIRSMAVSAGASNCCIFSLFENLRLSVFKESLGMPILRWRACCACMPMLAASTNMRSSNKNRRYVNVFFFNVYLVFWFLQRIENFHDVFQFFLVVERDTDFTFSFG